MSGGKTAVFRRPHPASVQVAGARARNEGVGPLAAAAAAGDQQLRGVVDAREPAAQGSSALSALSTRCTLGMSMI